MAFMCFLSVELDFVDMCITKDGKWSSQLGSNWFPYVTAELENATECASGSCANECTFCC
jgi:hypothetical protein